MQKLIKLIDHISRFGLESKKASENAIFELKKYLSGIYNIYLNIEADFDEKDYKESFDFNYKEIRKNVELNFPSLGFYICVSDIHELKYEKGSSQPIVNSVVGDSIDDITDIIKDMLEVKWRFDHTSSDDALWHFEFLMKQHSETHLLNLLKYLKDKEV